MKAAIYTRYGSPDVLQLQEVDKPTPKDNEVLIKVYAVAVSFGDLMVRNIKAVTPRNFTMPTPLWLPVRLMFGFRKPRVNILGAQLSGEIEAVGKDVTRFKPGDQIFAYPGAKMGGYAEYLCMREDSVIAIKPANMPYPEAATVPYGAITALPILRRVDLQPGQKILINGASGGIGSLAVQFAKNFGAEVTGVCGTERMEFVKSLGADHVIDYTIGDFTKNGETYDVILDILGKSSFSRCRDSLTSNGVYLLASFKTRQLLQMLWTSLRGGKKVVCALSSDKTEDLVYVKKLIEAGKITSSVDRCFPLVEAAEAHRYAESDQKKGNIVLTVRT
ncbi:MAG: NAD(P)-dependent alcohol dehydrogenase [Chloroflexi bacterium]|nr:NAD(P)-dependent alcohol dehydrogenase [Chloroflexota bacterium]